MPTNVPGSAASYPANIATPSDSDSPLASGQLRTAFTNLADRTEYLRATAPGAQVSASYTLDVASATRSANTFADVPGTSTGFTANANDRVEIYVKLTLDLGAGTTGEARCYWYNPDATITTITRSLVAKYASAAIPNMWLQIATMAVATQTGVHNLYVQHRSLDGVNVLTTVIQSILVKVYRP